MHSFSKDEIRRLLQAARAKRERDYLMLLVAYSHGLRACEVVAILPEHVRDGYLTVERRKGSKRTVQPLIKSSDPLFDEKTALEAWVAKCSAARALFAVTTTRFWQIVQEHGRTAGLPKHMCHPHTMKHSTAMHMIQPAGFAITMQYLGHVDADSTKEYLKVSDQEAGQVAQRVLGGLDSLEKT